MNEEETISLYDLLAPDTTWENFFPIKLELADEAPDPEVTPKLSQEDCPRRQAVQLIGDVFQVSTSKNNGVDCPVSTTSALPQQGSFHTAFLYLPAQ
jgi:hypothetical protein